MIVTQPPVPQQGPLLRDRIFNESLSKEFAERYEERFGRTEMERVYSSPNRFTYYNDVYGLKGTPQEINEERRKFADFMMRRLVEFHTDNFMRSHPRGRVIWEAKERLSNVRIEVHEYRIDMNYQLAGNYFDLKVVNPWFPLARMRVQMNPGALGPTPVDETTVSLGRPLTRTVGLESHYKTIDGVAALTARRSLTPNLATSLTGSTFVKPVGKTQRESFYLAGLTYRF